jgi:hypothetical protein
VAEHHCDLCGDEAWVAVGEEKRWLCFTHFADYLSAIRDRVEELRVDND